MCMGYDARCSQKRVLGAFFNAVTMSKIYKFVRQLNAYKVLDLDIGQVGVRDPCTGNRTCSL